MASSWSPHSRYRLYSSFSSYVPRFGAIDNSLEQFEFEICRRFGIAAAVCVPMARTGLFLTLLEMIRPGQKVIMSPLTIIDVVNAVLLAGGVPVFCDVYRESCTIDPDQAESLIDSETGAILLTHLHGQAADPHLFREICIRHNILLIEDAAQSLGGIENGKRLGTIGDAGIYSFGFFKNLSTWQGGMVVSNDQALISRIRNRVRNLDSISKRNLATAALRGAIVDICTWPPIFSEFVFRVVRKDIAFLNRILDPEGGARRLKIWPPEYSDRMCQWQARLGLRQLNRVDFDTDVRIINARRYYESLAGLSRMILPRPKYDRSHIYTYFPIQMKNRREVLEFAKRRGRDIAAQHLRNCADLPDFRELYRDCPAARSAAAELILLPTYPRYPATEVQRNIDVLAEYVALQ